MNRTTGICLSFCLIIVKIKNEIMGTLHEIYQIKPKVISTAAVLPVKNELEVSFLKTYLKQNEHWGIFSNTFVFESKDGKVPRIALYCAERYVQFPNPGFYILIQSGSKYGFETAFEENLKKIAAFLEDSLFYVIWDFLLAKYEIVNGVLFIHHEKNFNESNDFETYLHDHYPDEILAKYYLDCVIEMQLFYNEMLENENEPGNVYEVEDYEKKLQKLVQYKEWIDVQEYKEMYQWLETRISFQIQWANEHDQN